jgi:hypothetical protein
MAPGNYRAGLRFALRDQVAVEGNDGCQPAVDGAGLEAPVDLVTDETVHVLRVDVRYASFPHHLCEQFEITLVIPPGPGLWLRICTQLMNASISEYIPASVGDPPQRHPTGVGVGKLRLRMTRSLESGL